MWGIISEAFSYSNERSETIAADESLLDFFKARLEGSLKPGRDCGKASGGPDSSETCSAEARPNSIGASKAVKSEGLELGNLSLEQKHQVLCMSEMWGAYVGGSVEKQSLKNLWLEECIDGGM